MMAVFCKECKSYFSSIAGYVPGGLLLVFAGIYTVMVCLDGGDPNFEDVLANMSFTFIVLIPLLTMRCIADERRQRTDQLLYSLPLRAVQLVLGKYFAMLVVLMLPIIILCLFPLIISTLGAVNFRAAYSALVGFAMLAAAFTAVGMFISSLTDNAAVSAGLCFLAVFLNYFLSSLAAYIPMDSATSFLILSGGALLMGFLMWLMTKSLRISAGFFVVLEASLAAFYVIDRGVFEGLFPVVLRQMSLFERYRPFQYGFLDLTALFYDLSVCVLFVYMTIQSLENRRKS